MMASSEKAYFFTAGRGAASLLRQSARHALLVRVSDCMPRLPYCGDRVTIWLMRTHDFHGCRQEHPLESPSPRRNPLYATWLSGSLHFDDLMTPGPPTPRERRQVWPDPRK